MSRPILLPGLRRLWRGAHSLQLGTDPTRAIVFDLVEPTSAQVLDLLDGTRTDRTILREAADLGVSAQATTALLEALRDTGFVIGIRALLPANMIEPARRQILNEAVALAIADRTGDTPADVLRKRAAAHVLISGYGRLAAPIAAALAQAGVGHVDPALEGQAGPEDIAVGGITPEDTGQWRSTAAQRAVIRAAPAANLRPLRDGSATFIVQAGMYRPAELAALSYSQRGIPHLVVDIRDGLALVGPLVPPRGTPCLNCLDQYRRDHDPAWPAIAAQLSTSRHLPQPCATSAILAAVAYAVDDVLTFLDGGTPQTIGATIEIAGPGRERRRPWPAHPRCDCGQRRARSQSGKASRVREQLNATPRTLTGSGESGSDEVQ